MPSISDSTGLDTSGYTRTLPVQPEESHPEDRQVPARDSKLRFSAPYLPGTFPSSDTLTGFHLGGKIPQWRIPVPSGPTAGGAGSSTSTTVVSSSSSSTTTNNPPKAQTASITTPVINPGSTYTGVVTMAKAFVVLQVTVNVAARVRLYSTATAQTIDMFRPITQGPGYGTEQGIIGDVVLDTAPVVWQAVDMVGANGDSPQSTTVYITVDNISQASEAVTISIVYVPIQS